MIIAYTFMLQLVFLSSIIKCPPKLFCFALFRITDRSINMIRLNYLEWVAILIFVVLEENVMKN